MKRVSILLLLVANAALAQNVTVAVRTPSPTVTTGELVPFTLEVRNAGPGEARELRLGFGFTRGSIVSEVAADAGWTCTVPADRLACSAATLAEGATTTVRATVLVPNSTNERISAGATMQWRRTDGVLASTGASMAPTVREATLADLTITTPQSFPTARENTTVDVRFDIRQSATAPLRMWAHFYGPQVTDAIRFHGAGWTCTSSGAIGTFCSNPAVPPGAGAPITATVTTPGTPAAIGISGMVYAENVFDPDPGNSHTVLTLFVGNAERYEKVLIPFTPGMVRGAFGSLWQTEMTMLIDRGNRDGLKLFPLPCIITCINDPLPPLRIPFDPAPFRLVPSFEEGFFLYTSRGDAARLHFNIRVFDTSRMERTFGTEIPVVREPEVSNRIVLINIPVGGAFRHTVRIYDFDGIDGAQVRINVHSSTAGSVIESVTRTLRGRFGSITNARLPAWAAYATFDSSELRPPGTLERIWYSIEPLSPDVRIWAFATVTNNETQHVTTITPQ